MWILLLIVSLCQARPLDPIGENRTLIESLTAYSESEHAQIKEKIDVMDSIVFHWQFWSFSAFPMFPGQRCPYFKDHDKYRSIHSIGSAAYILDDQTVYVGTQYWIGRPGQTETDTLCYRVTAYRVTKKMKEPPYYQWERAYELMTVVCRLGKIIKVIDRNDY